MQRYTFINGDSVTYFEEDIVEWFVGGMFLEIQLPSNDKAKQFYELVKLTEIIDVD